MRKYDSVNQACLPLFQPGDQVWYRRFRATVLFYSPYSRLLFVEYFDEISSRVVHRFVYFRSLSPCSLPPSSKVRSIGNGLSANS